jgi:hypothetical protein
MAYDAVNMRTARSGLKRVGKRGYEYKGYLIEKDEMCGWQCRIEYADGRVARYIFWDDLRSMKYTLDNL